MPRDASDREERERLGLPVEPENFCPLAEHYTKCPLFRKKCDAINCNANPAVRKAKHAA